MKVRVQSGFGLFVVWDPFPSAEVDGIWGLGFSVWGSCRVKEVVTLCHSGFDYTTS